MSTGLYTDVHFDDTGYNFYLRTLKICKEVIPFGIEIAWFEMDEWWFWEWDVFGKIIAVSMASEVCVGAWTSLNSVGTLNNIGNE